MAGHMTGSFCSQIHCNMRSYKKVFFMKREMRKLLSAVIFCVSIALSSSVGAIDNGSKTCLADKGVAEFPIIIAKNASEVTRVNAATLASCLQKMSGATFTVETGDGSTGIVFGRQEDFQNLPKRFDSNPADRKRTEEYLLHSHPKGVILVGASDLAAQNAMWDFLGRQGYRQYFPGPAWEIIPAIPRIAVRFDEVQRPSYLMRSIWYSGGDYPENRNKLEDWYQKNRMKSGLYINAGHSYESFIIHNKEAFLKHPEYYALVNGKRQGAKLNIANPDLRKLFVEAALEQLRAKPEQISVSADPSDGGGWDESAEGKAIGSPSNQAILLANDVAMAVEKEFHGRYVGMYAYNQHAEPPTIKVQPNIFVLVTTGFRGTLLSMKDQMEGWKKQGASLGIRDYLSYAAANNDIPASCIGFMFTGFARKLKDYHDWGACLYSGESGANWGINGFLYYAMSRLLWDFNDTGFMDGLKDEFITNCFGPVSNDIRPYYEALSPTGNPILGSDFFHRQYASIEAARARKPGEVIESRLDALAVYVRYLELYKKYADASDSNRVQAAREMFSHLYRARFHSANSAYAIIRDIPKRDRTLQAALTDAEKKSIRSGVPLWEKRASYERYEILAMSAEGVKNNHKLDFKTVSFSKDLVPAASMLSGETASTPGVAGGQYGKSILYYTWAEKPDSEWHINVICSESEVRGKPFKIRPRIELWTKNEAMEGPVAVAEADIESGQSGNLVLKSPHTGLHWIVVSGARSQKLELDPGKPWTLTSSSDITEQSQSAAAVSTLYFYVPRGTSIIGGHFPGRGELFAPNGQKVKSFNNGGYMKIDVPKGMDGHLWKLANLRGGSFQLFTVPPYFAASTRDLLLPREVVEKDRLATNTK